MPLLQSFVQHGFDWHYIPLNAIRELPLFISRVAFYSATWYISFSYEVLIFIARNNMLTRCLGHETNQLSSPWIYEKCMRYAKSLHGISTNQILLLK